MEFKTRHLCFLLRNFKIISLVRKPKKYLKRRANFSKVASYQHAITPTSIYCFKFNYKRTRTRCEICSKLKTEIEHWLCSGVTVNNYSPEKCLPSNHLLGKKLLPQYLFNSKEVLLPVSKYTLDRVWIALLLHLNTPGKYVLLVKPLWWNKRKQSLKEVHLNMFS